ncbi:MAG TPA: hypothetical protein VLA96_11915 [Terriglobales bacterium]|nr:hypothetical protein [Terriglobales bacterium]
MTAKFYVDIFWFKCIGCGRSNHQKAYYRLFEKDQAAAVRRDGRLAHACHHCKRSFPANALQVHSMMMEVPEQEARSRGLTLDVGGQ